MATQRSPDRPQTHPSGRDDTRELEFSDRLLHNCQNRTLSGCGYTLTDNIKIEYYTLTEHWNNHHNKVLWVERDLAADELTVTQFTKTDGSKSYIVLRMTGLTQPVQVVYAGAGEEIGNIDNLTVYEGKKRDGRQVLTSIRSGENDYTIRKSANIVKAHILQVGSDFKITFERSANVLEKMNILSLALKVAICDSGIWRHLPQLSFSPLPSIRDALVDDLTSAYVLSHPEEHPTKRMRRIAIDFDATPDTPVFPPEAERLRNLRSSKIYTITPIAAGYYPKRDFLIVRDYTTQMPVYVIEVKVGESEQEGHIAEMKDASTFTNKFKCGNMKHLSRKSYVIQWRRDRWNGQQTKIIKPNARAVEEEGAPRYKIQYESQSTDEYEKDKYYNIMYTLRDLRSSILPGYCIARDGRKCATVVVIGNADEFTTATFLFTAMKMLTFATIPNTLPLSETIIDRGEQLQDIVNRNTTDHTQLWPPRPYNLRFNAAGNEFDNLIIVEELIFKKVATADQMMQLADYYGLFIGDSPRPLIIAAVKKAQGYRRTRAHTCIKSISLHKFDSSFSLMCEFTMDDDQNEVRCANSALRKTYGKITTKNRHEIWDDQSQLMVIFKEYEDTQRSIIKVFRSVASSNSTGNKLFAVGQIKPKPAEQYFKFKFWTEYKLDVRIRAMIIGYSVYILAKTYPFRYNVRKVESLKDLVF